MAIAELIFEILVLLLGLILIVSVILQKSKSEGITGVTATSESDNYFGKNKGLAGEEKLARITKVSTILFVIAKKSNYRNRKNLLLSRHASAACQKAENPAEPNGHAAGGRGFIGQRRRAGL